MHKYFNNEDSRSRIDKMGHRGFVGGTDADTWYGIGMLQYQYLIDQGLQHDSVFLDIACGSLRLGQFLIPYLDEGCYLGIDAEPTLIESGLQCELLDTLVDRKCPQFSINSDFDFSELEQFDYAIAQSLFTHLTIADISKCFCNLLTVATKSSKFYFTFFEGKSSENKDDISHANLSWCYSMSELSAAAPGWELCYVGDWNHPRNQKMVIAKKQ